MTTKKPLLKLLMLHGYRQSEKSFRERTGGLRKSLRNHAEFIFCTAPHEIPPSSKDDEATSESGEDQRGWWFSRPDSTYNAQETTDCDLGFDESLAHLNEIFKTQGPFDGIFSFSQGASLGAILCRIASEQGDQEFRQKYEFIRFKFAVLVAGFKSGQTQHERFFLTEPKCSMPTLHVIGEVDKVIPCELSNHLLEYFDNPSVFRHSGGHFVPVNSEAKNAFIDFFNKVYS